jgi:2-polyprenyl-3-methyl-5-hydroxy-6-metoxy-1,4-benzoquinol methylase
MKKKDLKNIKFFFDNYSKKFDEIYDTKTNSKSYFKIIINEIFRKSMKTRYILALNEVKKIRKKLNIIDIGCGPGRYAYDLAKLGHNITGIDISSDMINIAKKKNLIFKKKTNFIEGNYLYKNLNQKFDYAILNGFFDYIKEPEIVFKKLKKDCKIFLCSFPKLYHWLTPQRKIRYILRNCPLYFYTKTKIKKKLKIAGISNYSILDNSREYFVIGYCAK